MKNFSARAVIFLWPDGKLQGVMLTGVPEECFKLLPGKAVDASSEKYGQSIYKKFGKYLTFYLADERDTTQ